jgi:hypothetical protein
MTVIHPNQIVNGPNNLLIPLGHTTQIPGRPHLVEYRKFHVSCCKSNWNQIAPLQQEPTWIHMKPWLICIIGRHRAKVFLYCYGSVIVGCSTFYFCIWLASFGLRSTLEASFARLGSRLCLASQLPLPDLLEDTVAAYCNVISGFYFLNCIFYIFINCIIYILVLARIEG